MSISETTQLIGQIDYSTLVQSLSPIVLLYATNKFYQDYKLQKEVTTKYIKIKNSTNAFINNSKIINYQLIATREYSYAINEFINVMKKKVPEASLINFYNNINDVDIKLRKPLFIKYNILADYDVKKNRIRVFNNNSYTVIYHELLHMASSYYKDRIRYSGFKQTAGSKEFGQGINEGYTQLLTERYFGHVNEMTGIYEYEMLVASSLEKIVTKSVMEKNYFDANLGNLIKELSVYTSEEEVIKFILNTDFVNMHLADKNPSIKEKTILADIFTYNHQFLFKTYATKLKRQIENGIIDKELFKEKMIKYTNPLGLSVKVGNTRYTTLTVDYISNTLDEILGNSNKTKTIN